MSPQGIRIALIAGVVGAIATIIGFVVDPSQAFFSYLFAYAYVFTAAGGALILVLIGNAARSRWFLVFRRRAEAFAFVLVPLAVLFIPILFGLTHLYPWHRAALPHNPLQAHSIEHARPYLNTTFFVIRAVVYFAILIGTFAVLRRWSVQQDRDGAVEIAQKQRAFASAALPVVAFMFTFACFDWFMTLTAGWFSSAFGIYLWAGGFDAAMALIILVERRHAPAEMSGAHFSAIGRLLFAFTVFWAYIAYAQGFITWIANKPNEVVWYVPRLTDGWGWVGVVLIFAHFVIPFALLLPRMKKYSVEYLTVPAVVILVAHFVDLYWVILPNLHPDRPAPSWIDFAALLALGGLCFAAAGFAMRRAAALPEKAPDLPIGLRYEPQP